MTIAQKALVTGAVKSAVSSATGMILSLNIVDSEHFNVMTFGGWKHLGAAIAVTIIVSEARFWNQWASSGNHAPSPVPPA